MHRISSDAEYLDSGKIVIDADGIPIEPVSKKSFDDALAPKADKSYVDSAVEPKADKSYVDSSLAPKADKSYVDSLTPLGSFLGTGSPEGKITAPVGSVYTDSAATNGAIRWIKTSGTGNTGWVVEYGDTGIRDISNLLKDATGSVTISRIGQVVYLEARVIKPEETLGSGSTFLTALPVGFRPPSRRDFSVNSTLSSSTSRSGFQFTRGEIGVWQPSTSDIYYFQHSWITTNSWPTTLPGTPA